MINVIFKYSFEYQLTLHGNINISVSVTLVFTNMFFCINHLIACIVHNTCVFKVTHFSPHVKIRQCTEVFIIIICMCTRTS